MNDAGSLELLSGLGTAAVTSHPDGRVLMRGRGDATKGRAAGGLGGAAGGL